MSRIPAEVPRAQDAPPPKATPPATLSAAGQCAPPAGSAAGPCASPAGSAPGQWDLHDTRFVVARLVVQALSAVTAGIATWVLPRLADREWQEFLGYSLLAVALEALLRLLRDNRPAPSS